MHLRRLLPDQDGDWTLFELFQNRVRGFIRSYLPDINEQAAIVQLRTRWVSTPLDTGFWLALDDDLVPFGHLCAETQQRYGQIYVLFWQLQIDPNPLSLATISQAGKEIKTWISAYNHILQANGRQERIKYAESYTWIEPQIYERLFRHANIKFEFSRSVFRWDFTEEARIETNGRRERDIQ